MMVAKDYESWFPIKEKLDARAKDKLPPFKKRQIWWAHIGVNIGNEVFGKGGGFLRPVLIIKKYDNFKFLGAPLTSTPPRYQNHVSIFLKERKNTVLLDQLRTFDVRRLSNFYERVTPEQFEKVIAVLREGL